MEINTRSSGMRRNERKQEYSTRRLMGMGVSHVTTVILHSFFKLEGERVTCPNFAIDLILFLICKWCIDLKTMYKSLLGGCIFFNLGWPKCQKVTLWFSGPQSNHCRSRTWWVLYTLALYAKRKLYWRSWMTCLWIFEFLFLPLREL